MISQIINKSCTDFLETYSGSSLDFSFLDPPFNQSKEYRSHNDTMHPDDYWNWMKKVCELIYQKSSNGAAVYFMQREKNAYHVMKILEDTGWRFQNLIIWKKKSSAVPSNSRFGKHYQIIAFATKGLMPRVFNKLRIDPPLLETEKYRRPQGMFVTDVWDDIRELTSGYFAGDEPFRDENGERLHNQQSPIQLLLRIILSSTKVGDLVFDPFTGTGTTLVVSKQLGRNSIGTEIDTVNCQLVKNRLEKIRKIDEIKSLRRFYNFTDGLDKIWPN